LALAVGMAAIGALVLAGAPPATAPAYAQPSAAAPVDKPFAQLLVEWNRAVDKGESALADPGDLSDEDLATLKGTIEGARAAATGTAAAARVAYADAKKLADALGPAPAEGQPPETPELARQRQRLLADVANEDARAKQSDLLVTRADALLKGIADEQRKRAAATVLKHEEPPFSVAFWRNGGVDFVGALRAMAKGPEEWIASEPVQAAPPIAWYVLLGTFVVALMIAWPARLRLVGRFGRVAQNLAPTYARRVLAAGAEGVARGLLPVVSVGALYLALDGFDLVFGPFGDALLGAVVATAILFPIVGLAGASLSPRRPEWRVVPLEETSADRLFGWLAGLAAFNAVAAFLGLAIRNVALDPGVINVCLLVFVVVQAFLLWHISDRRCWHRLPDPDGANGRSWSPLARAAVRAVALVAPVAALFGYYNLATYLVTNVVNVGLAVAAYYILSTVVREGVGAMLVADEGPLVVVRRAIGLSDDGGRLAHFWLAGTINLALLGLLALALLPGFGVRWDEIVAGLSLAVSGITIGGFTLGLGDLFAALALFFAVMVATRFLQRTLESRILPHTRFDLGAQNSIRTATGYVGLILAAVIAITALGLDLSNLAIIAGALSVGIGFGLQNIVGNFVSGLIILAERPVKVGDWVVIGQHEGTVKRINVRATEIETATRASIIVPNSDLVSSALVNWTHKNKMGRVDIQIGVDYASDIEKVQKTLLDVALASPRVLAWPKPMVVFRAFGASTLDFELRAFVGDVGDSLMTRSELNFAIARAFRAAGIEVPFGQTDVHLRDIERIEKLVERIVEARVGAAPGLTAPPPVGTPEGEAPKGAAPTGTGVSGQEGGGTA
jgi:small-conductance mechanosensitive channel